MPNYTKKSIGIVLLYERSLLPTTHWIDGIGWYITERRHLYGAVCILAVFLCKILQKQYNFPKVGVKKDWRLFTGCISHWKAH